MANLVQMWSLVSGKVASATPLPLVNGFTKSFQSYCNFGFLLLYGVTMMIVGKFGDQIDPKIFLLIGQFAVFIFFGSIGFAEYYDIDHRYFILAMMLLNGMAQSTGWPGVVTIVDNWLPSKQNKLIFMGIFASCSNVGNLLADLIFGQMEGSFQLFWPIQVAAFLILSISLINLIILQQKPYKDEYSIDSNAEPSTNSNNVIQNNIESKPLSYTEVWKVKNAPIYALAFGLIKAVYYVLSFWLPEYLDNQKLKDSNLHQTWITSMLDFGSIPGGIVVCAIGYYTNFRASIIVPFLWLGTIVMICIDLLKNDSRDPESAYIGLVFTTGFLIGGVYNNIVSGIAQELGGDLGDNHKAVSTVVAFIEGFASIFAAFNQLVVPYVSNIIFLYAGLLTFLCSLLLLPLIISECKKKFFSQEQNQVLSQQLEIQSQQPLGMGNFGQDFNSQFQ